MLGLSIFVCLIIVGLIFAIAYIIHDSKEIENHSHQNDFQTYVGEPKEDPKLITKEQVTNGINTVNENIDNTLNNEETGMFSDVGGKIKSLAKACFVIGIISAVVTAIILIGDDDYFLLAIVAGLLEIAASWAFSLILYALGELVSNSKESKNSQQEILNELRKNNK